MQIFYKIVLPLSKAALASIGLMFAVTYWNDYTNFKIYITNADLYNFQMKLRSLIMGSDKTEFADYNREKILTRLNEARENRVLFKNIKY
jgi:ABC-type glycerol-3-phosphate transport system permease component